MFLPIERQAETIISMESGEETDSVVKGEEKTGILVKVEEAGSQVSVILNGIVL